MNKPRLEKLIVALKDAKAKDFTMHCYVASWKCNTPACVLGHYASRRDLQRAFTLQTVSRYDATVNEHFGITDEQNEALFSPGGCGDAQTPAQARRYIRKFIDSNGEVS